MRRVLSWCALRRRVYGIDYTDLAISERVRWEFAAGSVVTASFLSGLGMSHLIYLSTGNWGLTAAVLVVCVLVIFHLDRSITAPVPDFSSLPADLTAASAGSGAPTAPYRSDQSQDGDGGERSGRSLRARLLLSAVTIVIGGLGLAMLVNEQRIDARFEATTNSAALDRVQGELAEYFGVVINERDEKLRVMCRDLESDTPQFANFSSSNIKNLHERVLGPAIQALAGSGALAEVKQPDIEDGSPRIPDDLAGCDESVKALVRADPVARIAKADLKASSAPGVAALDDYLNSIQALRDTAEEARQSAETQRDAATGDYQRLSREAELEGAQYELEVLDALETVVNRWRSGLDEAIHRPDLAARLDGISDDWRYIVGAMIVVALFDLVPFVFARWSNRATGLTVEKRMAHEQILQERFLNGETSKALRAIDDNRTDHTAHKTAYATESAHWAGGARATDRPLTEPRAGSPRQAPSPAPAGRVTRRTALGLLGGAGVAVAGMRGVPALVSALETPPVTTAGVSLLRTFAKEFGLWVAIDLVQNATGLTGENITHALFGDDFEPAVLPGSARPDVQDKLGFRAANGAGIIGVGSEDGSTVYPTFAPTTVNLTPDDDAGLVLLAPHWLNVIYGAGEPSLDTFGLERRYVGEILFPQVWLDGTPTVARSNARTIPGQWETEWGTISCFLEVVDKQSPEPGTASRDRAVVTTSRARCQFEFVPNQAAPAALTRRTFHLDNSIPVPTVWT